MTTYPDNIDSVQNEVPWWVILLTGITALILGLLIVTSPAMTILTLVQFLAVYWLIGGIYWIVEIFFNSHNWGWKLAGGIIGILAGLTILKHPITSGIFIPALVIFFVAIEGIIMGIVSIFRAFREHSWGLGFLGILSILFGVAIFLAPLIAAQVLTLFVGIMAIIGGISAIFMSIRVHGEERRPALSQPTPTYQQVPVTGPDETETPESKEE